MGMVGTAGMPDQGCNSTRVVGESRIEEQSAWSALAKVHDPELPVNIVDLGLVYGLRIEGDEVHVQLTHTAIGCPAIEMMQQDVEAALLAVPGVQRVRVETAWDPPWNKGRLTPRGRAALLAYGISL
jgi:phenylacetate-CoA oxygenase PaaJ subunit